MNMVVSAAALTGTAMSQPASAEADPIFAAIEAHKCAVAAYNAICVQEDQLDAKIPSAKRKSRYGEIVETDDPRWIVFQKELDGAANVEDEAECGLASVTPTTLAGVIALLDYTVQIEKGVGFREVYFDSDDTDQRHGRSWYYFVNRNLADTLRNVAR